MESDEPAGEEGAGASDGRERVPPGEVPRFALLGRVRLPSTHDAPRAARAAIADWMPAALPRPVLHDAQLLISELVTNSVEHAGAAAGGSITVSACRADGVLWFEVTDAGREQVPTRRAPVGNGGMGLNILDAAALRWGTSHGDGTRVWFQLAF